MADQQELAVREKKEMATKEERTVPGRFYVPQTDVYETEDALTVVMEVPGVAREAVEIELIEPAWVYLDEFAGFCRPV